MEVKIKLNGKMIIDSIEPDMLLLDFCREHGCKSVKRGCDTSNCGACTVWMDEQPVLSCNILTARADGHSITTLEGLQDEAWEFGEFLAKEGGEQCGFCNPGFIMNLIAMKRDLDNPSDDEIKEYLAGNLCRCTGFTSHMRAIHNWLESRKEA